jgi:hypothetical protein
MLQAWTATTGDKIRIITIAMMTFLSQTLMELTAHGIALILSTVDTGTTQISQLLKHVAHAGAKVDALTT